MSPPANDRLPKLGSSAHLGRVGILGRHLWPKGETACAAASSWRWCCWSLAKVANVYVPLLYKHAVDALGEPTARPWRCRSR